MNISCNLFRAPSLPPGISADTVLDVLKNAAPQLYAQVCDCMSAHYNATMSVQLCNAAMSVQLKGIAV